MEMMSINRIMTESSLGLFDQKQTNQEQSSFMAVMENALRETNELQLISDQYAEKLATGQVDNLHDVIIAGQKADIAFQMVAAVRGKVMEAYREIMRMQI
ncbi:flagellar hook-basal body complex protein FliE [Anoxynatronum buryatiense]|uniref:Flagellar hook-basal body complex protein FliE n=1 Tax=Anoxynatronum buryatiense TaxID=489973 RepID=A0AA45WUB2_9CLOT|nr:flagellar hook-basal body complex protein FliE [Anoxynatronum buryatiense]SMP47163.1 flagellar hook-basal body complex protein FliE [Anoxynatronum buryatiense]